MNKNRFAFRLEKFEKCLTAKFRIVPNRKNLGIPGVGKDCQLESPLNIKCFAEKVKGKMKKM